MEIPLNQKRRIQEKRPLGKRDTAEAEDLNFGTYSDGGF